MKRRYSVNKSKSASHFRHQARKTKGVNIAQVRRGGIRL